MVHRDVRRVCFTCTVIAYSFPSAADVIQQGLERIQLLSSKFLTKAVRPNYRAYSSAIYHPLDASVPRRPLYQIYSS
jgi:hypothetical protein